MGTNDFNPIDIFIAKLRLRQILKFIPKDTIILDFGCGAQAYLLRSIEKKIKEGIGVDYDVENQLIGTKIKTQKLKFTNKIPLEDQHFDVITLLAVLEHIELDKIAPLFREFNRILKPNGKIILTTPTPKSKPILEFLANLNIISRAEIFDHKKYYNQKAIEQVSVEASLKVDTYKTFQFGLNSLAVLGKNA